MKWQMRLTAAWGVYLRGKLKKRTWRWKKDRRRGKWKEKSNEGNRRKWNQKSALKGSNIRFMPWGSIANTILQGILITIESEEEEEA